jgi:hypothetical protein
LKGEKIENNFCSNGSSNNNLESLKKTFGVGGALRISESGCKKRLLLGINK